jgi:cell pole-organizing protein PopZ
MGRAKTAQDPSIESLLDSIRRAIHDGSAGAEELAAAKAQPAAIAPKADAAEMPRPGKAPPAPLRPVQAKSPDLRPAQASELAGVRPALRPVQAKPAPQPPAVAGSTRETRMNLASAGSGPAALATRTDDFLALRNRLANLSVTRDRLSRTLSGQDNGFAGILGGDVRLEEALARAGGHKVPEHVLYGSFRDTAPALRSEPTHPASSLDDVAFSQLPSHGSHFIAGYESDAATYDPLGGCDDSVPLAEEQSYGYSESGEAEVGATDDYLGNGHDSARSWLPARPAHPGRQATVDPSGILSDDASNATASAFNRLADTIVAQATAGNRSVEEITREVLRPMLKSWLDEHLPRVVERLVREEIERVARRGGR